MTRRKIVIETCKTCPHRDHKGAFAKISYVPTCGKTGRELPYTVALAFGNMVAASVTDLIPDWCPLPKDSA